MSMFFSRDLAEAHFFDLVEEEGKEVIEKCECCEEYSVSEMFSDGEIVCGGSSGFDRICEDCIDNL